MTPGQRKTLARLALAVPRPMGRFVKSDPQGLAKLEAYVEAFAERGRGAGSPIPVLDLPMYEDKLTLRGRVRRWLGRAV